MPKITDAQYVTDTNGTGYIIGYQAGVFCRWPVTMAVANKWLSGSGVPNVGTGVDDDYYLDLETGDVYQKANGAWGTALTNIHGAAGTNGTNGANGVNGTNGADGVGVPSGGDTDQVLAKASSADYDCHWVDAASGGGITDLSSATSDYALAVGETAKIVFSSSNSIPLHIAAVEGIYELDIYFSRAETTGDCDVILLPNNVSVVGMFTRADMQIDHAKTDSGSHTPTGYHYPMDAFWHWITATGYVNIRISTFTGAKSTLFRASTMNSAATSFLLSCAAAMWCDYTTAWTSLGTIRVYGSSAFQNRSGVIIIKRIA